LLAYGVTVEGSSCLILGTGGSARAIDYALRHALNALPPWWVSRTPGSQDRVIPYADLPGQAARAALIVNCTPVGMVPNVEQSPWPEDVPFPADAVLYDLVYNPPVTRLMMQAQSAGARALGGLGMLVRQGALAFEQWTGVLPPLDVMFLAARRALNLV
jgi:shikimate dehydrogenase